MRWNNKGLLISAPVFAANIGKMAAQVWRAGPIILTGLMLLEIVQGLTPLATAWLTKSLFDLLVCNARAGTVGLPHALIPLLIALASLSIVSQLCQSLGGALNGELGRRLTLNVQIAVYRKINSLVGLGPFEDARFHDTIQLAAQGAQRGPLQTLSVLMTLVRSTLTLASFLTVLIAFNPVLDCVVGLAALPQLFTQLRMGRQRFGMAMENSPKERRASYYSFLLSSVQFAKEVRLFNLAEYFLQAFGRTTREVHQIQRAQQLRELRAQTAIVLLSTLVSSGTYVAVIIQAFSGRLSIGDVTLYTSAVISVQMAMSGIVVALSNLHEGALFYTRYADLIALSQPLPIVVAPTLIPPLTFGIEIRNVSFRYREELPWVLRDINLVIPVGRCVAIVGLNGAGKTTLVKLLTRLYDPSEGQILWDGIDIREFDPVALRARIGAIFQDFVRYDLTAAENIAMGGVAHIDNEDHIRDAAISAGAHDMITALPYGYKTLLSRWLAGTEPGVDLSGGEWQKIALARMFMRDSDFLMLDEPTAALDAQAEFDVYSRFTTLMQGRTSLLITHRFSTVRIADMVAVLEDGQITEHGPHDTLVAHEGTYAKLYALQADRYR